jgi:Na+-transporting NADH:ubiquinone oxidoreductase subunit NqrF
MYRNVSHRSLFPLFSCPCFVPFPHGPTGVCACSTCHIIAPWKVFDSLPETSEDEEDMLDMAFGLQETSRLGCQITVTQDMEGVVWEMPKATRNFYVDGHVPKPH